jgi:hypothetical protein
MNGTADPQLRIYGCRHLTVALGKRISSGGLPIGAVTTELGGKRHMNWKA